eukprot:TRINITY_DN183_c0_g1_i1.p1 TRINITY_DN183_c0_g1~~TRINITY_DN183_c0_g1_i1.p1  ORF type:complete len:291 (+),score=58.04 TRINITY_DN183_c0_g1_i1:78-950(+)
MCNTRSTNTSLCSKQWLLQHINDPTLKLLDSSWYMPAFGRKPLQEFHQAHIRGAQFFDIDKIADTQTDLPHMIPSLSKFNDLVSGLGINNEDTVVVYDRNGQYIASARAWWMFRLFGHDDVKILEGGYFPDIFNEPEYQMFDFVSDTPVRGNFSGSFRPHLLKTEDQILDNIDSQHFQVVDARPNGRFIGESPEPRPGLAGGHIPGSKNIPFSTLIDSDTRTLKSREQLRKIFEESGLDLEQPIATSCGSGVTAAILALGLKELGIDASLYDGSWSQYGIEDSNNPVDTI